MRKCEIELFQTSKCHSSLDLDGFGIFEWMNYNYHSVHPWGKSQSTRKDMVYSFVSGQCPSQLQSLMHKIELLSAWGQYFISDELSIDVGFAAPTSTS